MPAIESQLQHVINPILHFTAQTGLNINYNKLVLVPSNVSDVQIQNLINILGCQKGSFPFTYLDLPLNTSIPKIENFTPNCQTIEIRLVSAPIFYLVMEGATSEICFFPYQSSSCAP